MRFNKLVDVRLLVVAALLPGIPAMADPTAEPRLHKLPVAVVRSVRENFPGAVIRSYGREREMGMTYYEVNLHRKGDRIEVEIAPNGSIGEVETVVASEDLPRKVYEMLQLAIGAGVVKRIEKHERWGVAGRSGRFVQLVEPRIFFEATYDLNGQRREAIVRYKPEMTMSRDAENEIRFSYPRAQIRDVQVSDAENVRLYRVVLADRDGPDPDWRHRDGRRRGED